MSNARAFPVPDIKAIRDRLGMRQVDFAKAFGVKASAVRRWESEPETMLAPTAALFWIVERYPALVMEELERVKARAAL